MFTKEVLLFNVFIMKRIGLLMIILVLLSCNKNTISETVLDTGTPITKAVVPETFDWETADCMPTPNGQADIPVPWGDQGSISGFYGLDIVNDYKYIDGWRLLYSSFRDYGPELIDPYFMLYNVYRGTLRVYFYLTSQYIGESTYLKDGLSLSCENGVTSNLLNYLPGGVVDTNNNIITFSQLQPKMYTGGAPLAGRRWYMMEYELAYDPELDWLNSEQLRFVWSLDYVNVTEIMLEGNAKSEIYGTIGGAGNFWQDVANSTGEGVLSVLGLDLLNHLTVNSQTGENKIGLSGTMFKGLVNGITSVVNSIGSGTPSFVINFLSSVFGGKSNSSQPAVSLKSEVDINLQGNMTSYGAVSSTPISFIVPGTRFDSSVVGYVPLYDEPLGVFYWEDDVVVNLVEKVNRYQMEDEIMWTGTYDVEYTVLREQQQDFSQYIVFNPRVMAIANLSVVSQEVYAVEEGSGTLLQFPLEGTIYSSPWEVDEPLPDITDVCIKVVVKVAPKNGAPASYISKTFFADSYTITCI